MATTEKEALVRFARGMKTLAEALIKDLSLPGAVKSDDAEEVDIREDAGPGEAPQKKKSNVLPFGAKKTKAAPVEEAEEPAEAPGIDWDSIEELPRVKLLPIARALGIDTQAKQLEDLRAEVMKKRPGAKAAPAPAAGKPKGGLSVSKPAAKPAGKVKLKVLQDALAGAIEENYDTLKDAIDELGCGGDCYNCPTPETDGDVMKQVKSCLTSVQSALGLELPEQALEILNEEE